MPTENQAAIAFRSSRARHHVARVCATFLCVLVGSASGEAIDADLLIVGGTESGCAAAVQAARMGVKRIVLVNDGEWLGGQFTSEGLLAFDENRGPSGYDATVPFPRSGLFKEVIDAIETLNWRKYGVARPGNTRVITTCRPADAEHAFRELLRPYIDSGQVRVLSHHAPVSAEMTDGGRTLTAVRFSPVQASGGSRDLVVRAPLTIDASDWGDVIRAAGAEYEFGPDLKSRYGEPSAAASRDKYPLTDMNPITYCMVVVETDRDATIAQPADYNERNYRGSKYDFDLARVYSSRRVVDHYGFPQVDHPDVILLCQPICDYPLDVLPKRVVDALEADEPGASQRNIVEMTRRQREIVFDDAKRYSLGYLYYLQTVVEAERPDPRHSLRRFELTDEFGTADRLPPKPYVRESLRLQAMYMMREQDTLPADDAAHYARVMYHDGVACWQFPYDFHPTGRKFLDGDRGGAWHNYFRPRRDWGPPHSGRCLFALRSLVPVRVDGLLGAQKNLGYSSIVSSAVRLHDQSMAIGQAAGATAAVALKHGRPPREIPFDPALLTDVQRGLCARLDGGQPSALWPFRDVEPDHPAYESIHLLAVRRCLPLAAADVDFSPEAPATHEWRAAVVDLSKATKDTAQWPTAPTGDMSRGEFCRKWWAAIQGLPEPKATRQSKLDFDADGILDVDDPLPLDPSSARTGRRPNR